MGYPYTREELRQAASHTHGALLALIETWIGVEHPPLVESVHARYDAGAAEHGGTGESWEGKGPAWFDMETMKELVDAIFYQAQRNRVEAGES